MKVLILGSGGREHALAYKLAESPLVTEIIVIPGNPGIAKEAKCHCLALPDYSSIVEFAKTQKIDLTVVGPEVTLVDGVCDSFRQAGLVIFGPGVLEANLEGSKKFAKEFMREFGVATADYVSFSEREDALTYVRAGNYPLVVKASGLCAGKGVTICATEAEAETALQALMADQGGPETSSTVIIEDFLTGPEVSVLAIYDGNDIYPMISAMDHKRIGEGDTGPNTGGMGTIAPAPYFSEAAEADFKQNILKPTLEGMMASGFRDPACIFFGLMVTEQGVKLLEYNMRFGDPETQSVLTLLESDLYLILTKACEGNLTEADLKFSNDSALCIIGAAKGYPGPYLKDIELTFPKVAGIKVYFSGVREADGRLLSCGGRIFGATAKGPLLQTRTRLMNYMDQFKDLPVVWRKDIGRLKRTAKKV